MSLNSFNQTLTVAGTIVSVDPSKPSFSIEARSGDTFEAVVGRRPITRCVSNLDGLDRNRVPDPQGVARRERHCVQPAASTPSRSAGVRGRHLSAERAAAERFEARNVYLLHSDPDRYMFEETHWWPTQTTQMADRILDHLFDAKRSYTIDDFSEVLSDQPEHPRPGDGRDGAGMRRAVAAALRSVVRVPDDRRRALSDGGARRGKLPARGVPQPQPRRPVLLLGVRAPAQHAGRAGRIPAVRLAGPGRPRARSRSTSRSTRSPASPSSTASRSTGRCWRTSGAPSTASRTSSGIRRQANGRKGFAGKGGYYSHLDPATMRPDTMRDGSRRPRTGRERTGIRSATTSRPTSST